MPAARDTFDQCAKAADRFASDPTEPVLGVPVERADAMIPADLIQGDETVILLLKPSPLFIVLGCLGTLTIIALVGLVLAWGQRLIGMELFEERSLVGLCSVLGVLRIIWQFFEWMSRTYILTDRRVIRLMGVLRVEMFQAELRRLQHTQVLWSIRERPFGLGTICFSTAGTGAPEAYWVMVANPIAVHKKIVQAINRYGR